MYEKEDFKLSEGVNVGDKASRYGFISHESPASICLWVKRVASVKLDCARISCLHPDLLLRRERHRKLNMRALQVWESHQFSLQTSNPGCLPLLLPHLGRSNLQRALYFPCQSGANSGNFVIAPSSLAWPVRGKLLASLLWRMFCKHTPRAATGNCTDLCAD